MTLKYESQEFSDELKKRTNADKEYREKAKEMSLKTLFIVQDVPFAIFSNYMKGELVERKHIPPSEIEETRKKADFIVEIPSYELYVEMTAGKKSLASLFLSRMIKVEGSIFKGLRYQNAIEHAGKIAAQLTSESIIPSKEDFMKMLRERGLL